MFELHVENLIIDLSVPMEINKKYKRIDKLSLCEDLVVKPSWCDFLEEYIGNLKFSLRQEFGDISLQKFKSSKNQLIRDFKEKIFELPDYPLYESMIYYLGIILLERILGVKGVGHDWEKVLSNRAIPCSKRTIFLLENSQLKNLKKNFWDFFK